MTNNIELKFKLLSEFCTLDNSIEFCRQAYSFLMEDDAHGHTMPPQIPSQSYRQNGIYLIYEDGSDELFNGQNKLDGVTNVAFKFGPVALKLHSEDIVCSIKCDEKDDEEEYVTTCDDAVNDYNGAENTADMLSRGLSLELPENMFIPSLGQLYIMYPLKDKLNEALEYIGHESIEDEWYWSSTENSATHAWNLIFSNGNFSYNYKVIETRVRPVSAF